LMERLASMASASSLMPWTSLLSSVKRKCNSNWVSTSNLREIYLSSYTALFSETVTKR
jgi:hypothetical protein